MIEKAPAFHRQYAIVFSSQSEVNNFVTRNADKPWFEVNNVKVRLLGLGSGLSYYVERYVVLYQAQEPLS